MSKKWIQVHPDGEPPNRNSTSVVTYNEKLYMFGGFDTHLGAELDDFYEFDTNTSTWRIQKSDNPPPKMYGHSAVLYQDSMIVFGGEFNWGSYYNDIYKYSFKINSWKKIKTRGDPPCGRYFHTAVLRDNYMFIFGGNNGQYRLNDLYQYDIIACTWKAIETNKSPSPRSEHSACLYNDKMYIFGGYGTKKLNDLWEFECNKMTWKEVSQRGNIPEPRRGHASIIYEDHMYIYGGFVEAYSNDLFMFDFKTNIWKKVSTYGNYEPLPRGYHCLTIVNDVMYVIAGEGDNANEKIRVLQDAFQLKEPKVSRHIYEDLHSKQSQRSPKLGLRSSPKPAPTTPKQISTPTSPKTFLSPSTGKIRSPLSRLSQRLSHKEKLSKIKDDEIPRSSLLRMEESPSKVEDNSKTVPIDVSQATEDSPLYELFVKGTFTDVSFIVDGERFDVHRCIVSQCEKLEKEIFPCYKNKDTKIVVQIHGITPIVFKRLLDFLYTGIIQLSKGEEEYYVELVKTAQHYILPDLEDLLLSQFDKVVTVDNLLSILVKATELKVEQVRDLCFGFFHLHRDVIMKNKDILKLDQSLMLELLATVEKKVKRPSPFPKNSIGRRLERHIISLAETKQYSDILLVCDDGRMYPAHMIILASYSDFLANLLKHLSPGETELRVPVPGRVLDPVLKYIYHQKFMLPSDYDALKEIRKFSATGYKYMRDLDKMVDEKCIDIVDVQNVLEIMQYCKQSRSMCVPLMNKCWQVIEESDKRELIEGLLETQIRRTEEHQKFVAYQSEIFSRQRTELQEQIEKYLKKIREQNELIEEQKRQLEIFKMELQTNRV